jgi:putative aldouronate transport system permease protein
MLKRKGFLYQVIKYRVLLLIALPSILVCFLMAYIPMFGIILAFKSLNYKQGILGSPWVGLANFKFFFISGKALSVSANTALYNVLFIAATTLASILIAILVAEMGGKVFKKTAQSLMFLPYFISWVVVGALMYNIFNVDNGLLNHYIKAMGSEPLNIYQTPWYWYIILPALRIWKLAGYSSIIYLAAIMGIDAELYEAATIDGANRFQKIRLITLPMLKPTIAILLMLSLGGILRGDFEMFYQLIGANSMLYKSTDVIDTFVFRSLIGNGDIGMTSAAAFYQSVLCFVFITATNGLVRKINSEYALF